MVPTRTTLVISLAAGAAVTAAVLTGCSSHPSDASTASTSPGSRTPTPPSATPSLSAGTKAEQDALAVYRKMWAAFVHAGRTANAHDPALSRYAAGPALATITDSLRRDRRAHHVIKGRVALQPRATSVTPSANPAEVDIRDCADSSHWLVYTESGHLADRVPGGKHLVIAKATYSRTWQITALAVHGVGSCT